MEHTVTGRVVCRPSAGPEGIRGPGTRQRGGSAEGAGARSASAGGAQGGARARALPRTSAIRRAALTALLAALACSPPDGSAGAPGAAAEGSPSDAPEVRPGIEVLVSDSLHLVRGRRVGLVTNHTGRDRRGTSSIDLLAQHPDIELVALYSPEHGIRGEAEAGEHVASGTDPETGLPVHSLYGETRRPTPEMLEGVEVLVFDIQDVGARYYTYVYTLAHVMEAAGEAGIPVVVADRPNPIRGDVVQGNLLDPEYASFVGLYRIPMRHGMTPGELARMYVGEFGVDAQVTVAPVDGWRRGMTFDDTGLPWRAPSPNMPSVASALAYPGTCLFEGTPLSVGRGTDRAFQWVGAPWLDGEALAGALRGYGFEGVDFEPVRFTPRAPGDGKFPDTEVAGVRVVGQSSDYDAPRVAVAMLVEARRQAPGRWSWREAHFDRLAGTDALRLGIKAGQDVDALTAGWAADSEAFRQRRADYLIY